MSRVTAPDPRSPRAAPGPTALESDAEPILDLPDTPAGRILRAARDILVRDYYSGLRMDALAFELGMSKKTLYAHFESKDAIVAAIFEATGQTIRRRVSALLEKPQARFLQQIGAVLTILGGYFGTMTPGFLQDLQRFAPELYRQLDALKERNIPLLFGQVLQLGVTQGAVRGDLEVPLVVEIWLHIIKGVHDPASLARTGLTPRQAFDKALDLFLRGLLTPQGRKQLDRSQRPRRRTPGRRAG
jgi:AcrR family transcriptional regulator